MLQAGAHVTYVMRACLRYSQYSVSLLMTALVERGVKAPAGWPGGRSFIPVRDTRTQQDIYTHIYIPAPAPGRTQ